MPKHLSVLLVSTCLLGLSACSDFRDYDGAPEIDGATETEIGALGNERFQDAAPVSEWWETLADTQLDALITQSLDTNKDAQIALANLFEARAIARETSFDRFPTVTARGSATRNRNSGEAAFGPGPTPGEGFITNNVDAGFDASWELDLFGRVSEAVKANDARAVAAQANLRDVYVTIASEVARTYMELRGAQYRLSIAERNANNQRETYALTKRLEEGGRSTALDIAQAETQLELTESTIPTLEAQVNATIHRLSVLTGQVPDALRDSLIGVKELPSIPQAVNVGNVSDLLRRRPDIQRAEQTLIAAVADYNVSVADQFPIVNITGTLGFAATSLSSFGATALVGAIGPSISWSAFDIGRVNARINQNDARAQAAIASYEKTVLEALEELQTAVSDFSKEEERRARLQNAARASKLAAELSRTRYEAGVDTFLNVLNAEARLLEAEDTLAQSEISAAVDLITIYKALGGGWQIKVPST